METRKTVYAIATSWVIGIMTVTGVLSVAHTKSMMEGFAHLGYPAYFALQDISAHRKVPG